MTVDTSCTYEEIKTQPAAWQQAIDRVTDARQEIKALLGSAPGPILLTGCGSTHYLSAAAAALFHQFGRPKARVFPASEVILYPETVLPAEDEPSLLIVSSRSGRTSETLAAVEAYRKAQRGPVLTISNTPDAPLASMGDLNIVIPDGQEEGIAQTRSFTSMYTAQMALVAVMTGQSDLLAALPGAIVTAERLIGTYEPMARELGQDDSINRFFILGSGPRYPMACEVSLKVKEMSLSSSEPFYFMEFRHGPISMVDENTLVIALLSDQSREHEEAVLDEVRKLGGRTLTLAEQDADVSFDSGLPEAARGALYLPVLHLMAYYKALSKGLDPDVPNNLVAYVELDLSSNHA